MREDAELTDRQLLAEGLVTAAKALYLLIGEEPVYDTEQQTRPNSITCPKCGTTTSHSVDVAYGWCNHCRDFTGEWRRRRHE